MNKIKDNKFINYLLVILSIFASLLLIELYLTIFYYNTSLNKVSGIIKYSKESKLEVISNYNKKNNAEMISLTTPRMIIDKKKNYFTNLHPFSSISFSETLNCNENGYWSKNNLDRYGFNNPDKNWDESLIDILLVGDSAGFGYCVDEKQSISGILRENKNLKVLNISMGGNGPLHNLGSLIEFAKIINVKNIIWIHNERNDIKDLNYELNFPILLKYLNHTNFSQNLPKKQTQVNNLIFKYYNQSLLLKQNHENHKYVYLRHFIRLIKLNNFRAFINDNFFEKINKRKTTFDLEKIFSKVKDVSKKNDAKLFFVYLPEIERYTNRNYSNDNYDYIVKILKKQNINLSNLHLDLMEKIDDPVSLFPLRRRVHFTPEGYKLIAETIYENIYKQ